MTLPANSLDLNLIENVCRKQNKKVHDKATSNKVDLLSAFQGSWNLNDEVYCLYPVKSMPQREYKLSKMLEEVQQGKK